MKVYYVLDLDQSLKHNNYLCKINISNVVTTQQLVVIHKITIKLVGYKKVKLQKNHFKQEPRTNSWELLDK